MTQLIADSLSRLLGANRYPLMLLPTPVGLFLPGENHERHYPTDAQ